MIGEVEINTDNEEKGAIAGEAGGSTTITSCFTTYESLTPDIASAMT